MFIFLTAFTLIYCGMHLAAAEWLIRHFQIPFLRPGGIRLVFAALAILFMASEWLVREYPCPATRFLITGTFIWMGVIFLWLSYAAVGTLAELAAMFIYGADIRHFLAWPVLTLAAVSSAYALFSGYHTPRIHKIEIPVKGLAQNLDGFKIVQISDIHLSVTVGPASIKRMVHQIEKTKPDLILLTGDIIDPGAYRLKECADMLASMNPPFGKFAVLGNHEYYLGLDKAIPFLSEAGFVLLRQTLAELPNGIQLIGVDDLKASHVPDAALENLFSKADPRKLSIYMTHQPLRLRLPEKFNIAITLAGHTHGGQIFPFNLVTKLFYTRSVGKYPLGAGILYVNPGTFHWGPPMRFFVPEEITVLILRPAESHEKSLADSGSAE